MDRPSILRLTLLLVIAGILISSCQPRQNTQSPLPIASGTARVSQNGSTQAPAEISSNPSSTQQESGAESTPTQIHPTPTPIVEKRLPPEQWREWPVVPELTGREQAIYQLGRELGNDPHSFSKVGDCQAIKDVLMGIYDSPDRYYLTNADAYLQETIDYFAGSFGRDGQAVRGGYNAAAVLSPVWADPEVCNPGETPIECEYNVHRPSFVIISLEVWWEGRTVERYEEYMRQIIDFYISNGVVPILSTKADNVEGDHRINLATARLAYEYHIPLWNFWRAVQSLPNQGIDPNRDGFHISYEAWTIRSYTALQALDAVWRGVKDQQKETEIPIETPQPGDVINAAPIDISPEPIALPGGLEDERLVFSILQRTGEQVKSQGIFVYDLENQMLYQAFDAGYSLVDINTMTNDLLISQDQQLFIGGMDGQNLQELTSKLAMTNRSASAFWMPDGEQILVLTEEEEGNTLWLVSPATNNWTSLAQGDITGILKPGSDGSIFWYVGSCESDLPCEDAALWHLNNGEPEAFAKLDRAEFSNNGDEYAWVEPAGDSTLILYTRNSDQSGQSFIYIPGNRLVDMNWSPSTNQLALLSVTRSDYTGKSTDAGIFVVNMNTLVYPPSSTFPGLNPRLYWKPDGNALLLSSTLPVEQSYQLNIKIRDVLSNTVSDLNEELNFKSADYLTINQLFWILAPSNGG